MKNINDFYLVLSASSAIAVFAVMSVLTAITLWRYRHAWNPWRSNCNAVDNLALGLNILVVSAWATTAFWSSKWFFVLTDSPGLWVPISAYGGVSDIFTRGGYCIGLFFLIRAMRKVVPEAEHRK